MSTRTIYELLIFYFLVSKGRQGKTMFSLSQISNLILHVKLHPENKLNPEQWDSSHYEVFGINKELETKTAREQPRSGFFEKTVKF